MALQSVLRPHQIDGAHKMHTILQQEGGVLLSDALGLGKTRQVIALLALLDFTRAVILVPASVLPHWKNEFELMHGDERHDGKVHFYHRSIDGTTVPECTRLIVVTTTQTFENNSLHTEHWDVVVVDEATSIKNPKTTISMRLKSMKPVYRVLITGTPSQNNLNEIHSLFEFIAPEMLGPKDLFDKQFSVPVKLGTRRDASEVQRTEASRIINTLQRMISPLIVRRTLAKPVSKREMVVWCKQEPLEQDIYSALKSKKNNDHELRSILNGTATKVMDGHLSGKQKILQEMILRFVQTDLESVAVFVQRIDLMIWIVKTMESKGITVGVIHGSVSASKRQNVIDDFNADRIQLLVATTRSSATGINLTSCAHLIIAEVDWNASVDDQAAARSFRLSSTVNTTVYRLITSDTIEQKIYDVQLQKTTANQALMKGITEPISSEDKAMRVVDWPSWTPNSTTSSHDSIVAKLSLDEQEYRDFCHQYKLQKHTREQISKKAEKNSAFATRILLKRFITQSETGVSTRAVVDFHKVLFEKHRVDIKPTLYRRILYKVASMNKQSQLWNLKQQ